MHFLLGSLRSHFHYFLYHWIWFKKKENNQMLWETCIKNMHFWERHFGAISGIHLRFPIPGIFIEKSVNCQIFRPRPKKNLSKKVKFSRTPKPPVKTPPSCIIFSGNHHPNTWNRKNHCYQRGSRNTLTRTAGWSIFQHIKPLIFTESFGKSSTCIPFPSFNVTWLCLFDTVPSSQKILIAL